jgi:hypothetical protein
MAVRSYGPRPMKASLVTFVVMNNLEYNVPKNFMRFKTEWVSA